LMTHPVSIKGFYFFIHILYYVKYILTHHTYHCISNFRT
jgi:hypothetical protein